MCCEYRKYVVSTGSIWLVQDVYGDYRKYLMSKESTCNGEKYRSVTI